MPECRAAAGTRRVVKNYPVSLLPGYPGTRCSPTLGHLTNFFYEFLRIFLISENSSKIREFFFAEATNSRSMVLDGPRCKI